MQRRLLGCSLHPCNLAFLGGIYESTACHETWIQNVFSQIHESSFDIKLSKNPSDPERYLRTRIIGACEALDVQLGFNQYHMSRSTVFLVTEINPTQRLLKTQAQLKALAADSEDVFLQ